MSFTFYLYIFYALIMLMWDFTRKVWGASSALGSHALLSLQLFHA